MTNDTPKDTDNSPEDVQMINDILKQGLKRYEKTIKEENRDYNDDINALQVTITEFLSDFIIMGYTPDNRRVVIRYAPTPKGYDSLKELARVFMTRMILDGGMIIEDDSDDF